MKKQNLIVVAFLILLKTFIFGDMIADYVSTTNQFDVKFNRLELPGSSSSLTSNRSLNQTVEIQIGDGTEYTAPTEASPINIFRESLRSQTVYTANEINNAGFYGQGKLIAIGFYIHTAPHHDLPLFTVRVKHTLASDASSHDHGPFVHVFNEPLYTPQEGTWDFLEFEQPFYWNGIDNILIDTAFGLAADWNPSGQVRKINSLNGFRFTRSSHSDQTDAETTNILNYKPQIKMIFSFVVPPSDLTANAGNGVVELLWEHVSSPYVHGYNVYRDGVLINDSHVINNDYSDTDVTNGITYSYYVTAVYFEDESEPSNTVEATPFSDDPPQNLTAEIVDKNNVLLEWEAPFRGFGSTVPEQNRETLTGFKVYRNNQEIGESISDSLKYLDENLDNGLYVYYVTALYGNFESEPSNEIQVKITESSSYDFENQALPTILLQNYPNPFNPETSISFYLSEGDHVRITVYDIKGQKLLVLVNDYYNSGKHTVFWDGKKPDGRYASSGLYFYRMTTNSDNFLKKMILIK